MVSGWWLEKTNSVDDEHLGTTHDVSAIAGQTLLSGLRTVLGCHLPVHLGNDVPTGLFGLERQLLEPLGVGALESL